MLLADERGETVTHLFGRGVDGERPSVRQDGVIPPTGALQHLAEVICRLRPALDACGGLGRLRCSEVPLRFSEPALPEPHPAKGIPGKEQRIRVVQRGCADRVEWRLK